MKRMEQPRESPGGRGRSPSSPAKDQNNCSAPSNPTLNPSAPPRSPLSTVAVQAVFHKSRSHSHSEKTCTQPLPQPEHKPSVTSSSSFLNAAFTVCLPPSNSQIDTPAPSSPVPTAKSSCPQGQSLGPKPAQCPIAPQCQYESEDESTENQRSARDYEASMRSAAEGSTRPQTGAANFEQPRCGSCVPVDQGGGGRCTRNRRGLSSECRSCQYDRMSGGQPGCCVLATTLQQRPPRTNDYYNADNYDGVPQPPPPPPMRSSGRCVKQQVYRDPACDPDNPYILQFQDVTAAAFMIRNAITTTPCVNSRLSRMCGMDVFLKKDFMQLTGSFKERGARYALLKLTPEQRATGIVAASLGNHALALACHGAQLGIPVTVVMPIRAPLAKVSACRAYGANLIIEGEDLGQSRNIALELANTKGLTYINGYDHPHILAGQGTLGLELLEQVCDIDAIIIPVGGGGLLAGVATAAKTLYPNIKIIAVESENCASFSAALAAGKPVMVESQATIADGLAVPMVGVNAFASAAPLVDRTIVVNEDLISLSILRVVEVEKNVVEGAGAAGIAAVLSGQLDEFKDKRVVILACGGNIDVSMLGRCLERGLVADGRLLSFTVFVEQNPTSLSDLFALLGRVGASIKDMVHDRKWDSENFFLFPVKIIVETPGASTSRELRTALSQMYKKICFHHNFEPITSHQPMYPDFPKVECCGGAESSSKRNTSILMVKGGASSSYQRESVVRWPDGLESRCSPTHQRRESSARGRSECQENRSCQRRDSVARRRSECQGASPSNQRCESVTRGRSECQDADQRCESVARGRSECQDSRASPTNQRRESVARGRSECQENRSCLRRDSVARGRSECQDSRASPTSQRCESVARGRSECQDSRASPTSQRCESVARGRSECQDTDQRCESVARGPPDSMSKGSCAFPQDQSLSARCVPKEARCSSLSPAPPGSPH